MSTLRARILARRTSVYTVTDVARVFATILLKFFFSSSCLVVTCVSYGVPIVKLRLCEQHTIFFTMKIK